MYSSNPFRLFSFCSYVSKGRNWAHIGNITDRSVCFINLPKIRYPRVKQMRKEATTANYVRAQKQKRKFGYHHHARDSSSGGGPWIVTLPLASISASALLTSMPLSRIAAISSALKPRVSFAIQMVCCGLEAAGCAKP